MSILEALARQGYGEEQPMENEFICNGPEEDRHETEARTVVSTIGTSPEAPACPVCDRDMARVWGGRGIKYHAYWSRGVKPTDPRKSNVFPLSGGSDVGGRGGSGA